MSENLRPKTLRPKYYRPKILAVNVICPTKNVRSDLLPVKIACYEEIVKCNSRIRGKGSKTGVDR